MSYLRNILILTLFTCFCAGELAARSYFLPDYQNKTFKGRTSDGWMKDKIQYGKCETYDNAYSTEQPNMTCHAFAASPGLTCYRCDCSDYYIASIEQCSEGKIPDPNDKCGGKSKSCICDPNIYKEECEYGYTPDTTAMCSDNGGDKYKCVEDPCAGMELKSTCNNTVAGGYCVASEVEGCEEYCSDCVEDYCQGMGQYGGAIYCDYGCMQGYEIEGCTENLCKEGGCASPVQTCSDNNDGNTTDASALIDDPSTPYDYRCAELGYTQASCDAGYQKVGCPFNVTTGHYYHCVPIEFYTPPPSEEPDEEPEVETCSDGFGQPTRYKCDSSTECSSPTAQDSDTECIFIGAPTNPNLSYVDEYFQFEGGEKRIVSCKSGAEPILSTIVCEGNVDGEGCISSGDSTYTIASCSKILTCDEAIEAKGGVRLKQGMSLQSDTTYYMTENVGHSSYAIGSISNVTVYDAAAVLKECANDSTVTANPMIEASQATLIQNTSFYVPVKIRYFSTYSTEDISITAYNNLWIGIINRTGGVGVGSTYITVEDNPYYDIPLHFKVRAGFVCEKTSASHTNSCYIELLNNSDNGYIEYCDYSQAYNDQTDEEYWINDNNISGDGDDVGCTYSDWLEGGDWYDGP